MPGILDSVSNWWSSLWSEGPEDEDREPEYDPYDKATRSKVRLATVFNEVANRRTETERLVIRRWTKEDAGKMAAFFNRDGGLYQSYYFDEEPERLKARDFRRHIFRDLDRDYPYDMAIFTKDEKRIIGALGFWEDGYRRPHLTYFVSPTERRHGYAHEAYMAKLKEFGTYGTVEKMTAEVAVKNIASQEFLKKAGFQPAGEIEADCGSLMGEPAVLMVRDMADLKIT